MNNYQLLTGDSLAMLHTLPDASVHCVVTSPPYFRLRDYGIDGQIGLEKSPIAYIARLVDVFREVRRVLRNDGTLWLNIADSFASDSKWGGCTGGKHVTSLHGAKGPGRTKVVTGLEDKNMIGIPWRLAFALQDDGWNLRQDIIWHKTAPMPESVRDRCTRAHEYLFMLTKSKRYFYDAVAIEEPTVSNHASGNGYKRDERLTYSDDAGIRGSDQPWTPTAMRNKRSVWTLSPEPTHYEHYAAYPTKLVEPCILSGTSAAGCCPQCGAPWTRVTEAVFTPQLDVRDAAKLAKGSNKGLDASNGWGDTPRGTTTRITTGWQSTCTCAAGAPVACTVLDPFAGSGTTLRVAVANGRRAIGIELNPEYVALAERLLGQTQPALLAA